MVWGIEMPGGSFGPFFPEGKFVGYDEQLEAAFSNMTEEEKGFFNNRVSTYQLYVSQCFKYEHGTMHGEKRKFRPVEEYEWPREFRTNKNYRKLGSIFKGTDQLLIVDGSLKEVIENIEPGIHQFRPIRLTYGHGEIYPNSYYNMVIGRFLNAFDPDQSVEGAFVNTGGSYSANFMDKEEASGLAIRRNISQDCHLWRERKLRRPSILLSDLLKGEIEGLGLTLPTNFQMREV